MNRLLLTCIMATIAACSWAFDIVHGPYLQNLTDTEVSMVWVTDEPSVGWVELAPNGTDSYYSVPRTRYYDTDCGVKRTTRVHVVKISGLTPGTTYRYRAYSTLVTGHNVNKVYYGETKATNPYTTLTFTTSDNSRTKINFAVVNDIHEDNQKLTDLIGKCDLKTTDFFIFNGDMTSAYNDENQVFAGFMDTACKLFAGNIPSYYVRGNHETRGNFSTEFHKYFNPTQNKIYYSFRYGPAFFIMLDTGEDKPDTDIEYYGITDYDNYRTEQAEWLKKVVASDDYKNAPFKIVIAHMPPRNAAQKGWHGEVDTYEKFVPILNEAKPDVMICAHLHRYMFHKPDADVKFPYMVNSNKAVVKVEIDGNKMTLTDVNLKGKVVDTFKVEK